MPVDATHPEYDAHVHRWKIVLDVVNSKVKEYIFDIDETDKKRNREYKARAQFTNFTSRTKNGLVGQIFRRDTMVELPESIDYLKEDATGTQLGLEKLAQETTGEVLQTGRYGLLVDFPAVDTELTQAETEALDLKARIYKYNAPSILNWDASKVNGIERVNMVVLRECHNELQEDGFTWLKKDRFRVLRLFEGVYTQFLYKHKTDAEPVAFQPTDANGLTFNFIPFVFVGSEDNDFVVDSSPLYDIAQLNLGHLRNSADYEEAVFIAGQPTLFVSLDMSPEAFIANFPSGIRLGSRTGFNLGAGGTATLLQPNVVQVADEAMKRKESQMQMMGARISNEPAMNETAEAARGRRSGETSVLAMIRNNVNDAINRACSYVLFFMDKNWDTTKEEINVQINKDFFDKTLDPQKMLAQLQLANNGIISKKDIRDNLRKFGEIDSGRTDEDIQADVQTDIVTTNPFGI